MQGAMVMDGAGFGWVLIGCMRSNSGIASERALGIICMRIVGLWPLSRALMGDGTLVSSFSGT